METCKSTGLKTGNQAVISRPAHLHAITIIPGSAACSLTVYDGTSATGTEMGVVDGVANGASVTLMWSNPCEALIGIYAVVTGTGASYLIHYSMA